MGTTEHNGDSWKVDLVKFRIYLEKKYNVEKAYYFLGYVNEKYQDLYSEIQEAGFILIFKQHTATMQGKKKGNVDTDIVFHIMKKLYKQEFFNKIILVSGDGDYKILVDFLVEEKRLKKLLFPNKQFASSLYKKMVSEFFDYLDQGDVKNKIKKEKGSLGS
ncbi:NYN domain-containing protein [Candidatus Parcubacteria bacterium]|nr:NYN domain-containing protein [Candidatus Parcubacteria bacterium]